MTEAVARGTRKTAVSDDRLDRIEGKLDEVAKALIALVRVEERTTTLFKQSELNRESLVALTERVNQLERKEISQGIFFRWIDKIGLAVATAVVIYFVTQAGIIGDGQSN